MCPEQAGPPPEQPSAGATSADPAGATSADPANVTSSDPAGAAGADPRSGNAPRPDAPPKDPRHALGRLGEQLAATHLERLGFAILARNARTRYGEIDVIAFDGQTLVFNSRR